MRQIRFIRIDQPPRSVLMQVLGFVVGFVALVVAVILGGFLLAALLGFALIAAVVIYARVWWTMRKTQKVPGRGDGDQIIETEYRVIETTEPDDRGE